MLTSLGAETRILNRLNELKTTAMFLCRVDGRIGSTRLGRALTGLQDLANEDAIRLLNLTARMVELRDAFAPIPINWSNPREIQYLLENLVADPEKIKQNILELFRKDLNQDEV